MASRSTRKRVARRDRRKAKQSDWRRAGKVNPRKVSHAVADPAAGDSPPRTSAKKRIRAGMPKPPAKKKVVPRGDRPCELE
jgi:hypothetical protein